MAAHPVLVKVLRGLEAISTLITSKLLIFPVMDYGHMFSDGLCPDHDPTDGTGHRFVPIQVPASLDVDIKTVTTLVNINMDVVVTEPAEDLWVFLVCYPNMIFYVVWKFFDDIAR